MYAFLSLFLCCPIVNWQNRERVGVIRMTREKNEKKKRHVLDPVQVCIHYAFAALSLVITMDSYVDT